MSGGPLRITLPPWIAAVVRYRWLSTILGSAAWMLAVVAGWAEGLTGWILAGVGLVLVLFQAVRSELAFRRREAELDQLRQQAIEASKQLIVLLSNTFEPITEILGRIATTYERRRREQHVAILTQKVLEAAAQVCGPEGTGGTRACFYEYQDDGLTFVTHHGRGDRPRRRQLPEAAVGLAAEAGNTLVTDIADDEDGKDFHFEDATYRTYLSCAVYAGESVYGLLTVDCVDADTLSRTDLRSALVLANVLGAGRALHSASLTRP